MELVHRWLYVVMLSNAGMFNTIVPRPFGAEGFVAILAVAQRRERTAAE